MKPLPSNKTINKFRVVLSIPEMDKILSALHKDVDNLIENAELIGWITKQKRKAEFNISEPSHTSASDSVLVSKTSHLTQEIKDTAAKDSYTAYAGGFQLTDAGVILALKYKAENVLTCGSLTEEETAVLNEAMTKELLGGL